MISPLLLPIHVKQYTYIFATDCLTCDKKNKGCLIAVYRLLNHLNERHERENVCLDIQRPCDLKCCPNCVNNSTGPIPWGFGVGRTTFTIFHTN